MYPSGRNCPGKTQARFEFKALCRLFFRRFLVQHLCSLIVIFQAQAFVHDRACRCVLQPDFLLRLDSFFRGKRSKRGFVEATQDQFLLARVVIEIFDSLHVHCIFPRGW